MRAYPTQGHESVQVSEFQAEAYRQQDREVPLHV